MPHPLVLQLRFTRREFQRALQDVTPEEATCRFEPINCISWIIGHLAWQEQRYWLTQAQGITIAPEVNACGNGQPTCTPPLDEMWSAWHTITQAADEWLDTLDSAKLTTHSVLSTNPPTTSPESIGTRLLRTTYHYWYHMGESQAIRQLLGHTDLPSFVGDIGEEAPYLSDC